MSRLRFHVLISKCEIMNSMDLTPLTYNKDDVLSSKEVIELKAWAEKYDRDGEYKQLMENALLKKDLFDLDFLYLDYVKAQPMSLEFWGSMNLRLQDSSLAWVLDPESEPYKFVKRIEFLARKLCNLNGLRKVKEFEKEIQKWQSFCKKIKEAEICMQPT